MHTLAATATDIAYSRITPGGIPAFQPRGGNGISVRFPLKVFEQGLNEAQQFEFNAFLVEVECWPFVFLEIFEKTRRMQLCE